MRICKHTSKALLALAMENVDGRIPMNLEEISKQFICGQCETFRPYTDDPTTGLCKFNTFNSLPVNSGDLCPRQRMRPNLIYFVPKGFMLKIQDRIFSRDNFQCQRKGVHHGKLCLHIINNKLNDFTESNLVTLCVFHSKSTRYSRFWTKILEEQMRARYPPEPKEKDPTMMPFLEQLNRSVQKQEVSNI